MRLRVERFDVKSVKPHRSILFVGRSGAGKSVCMFDWLAQLAPRYDYAIFFTPTLEVAERFRAIAPKCFVYERSLDLGVLASLMEVQRDLLSKGKERHVLLCTDDCGFEKSTWTASVVRSLLMNGRHLRISWWNCVQFVLTLPPDARTQIGYWVCTSEGIHSNKKRLHDAAFGCIEKYRDFDSTFTQITRDYKVAVLDTTDPSSKLEKQLYWYQASLKQPRFTIGRPVFWKLQKRHRRPKTALSIVAS
jgi:hypothetical protein